MGRPKNVPKKRKSETLEAPNFHLDYTPTFKKRRKSQGAFAKSSTILFKNDISQQYFIGKLRIGSSNNVLPKDCEQAKVSFRPADESEHSNDEFIILTNDNVTAVIKCDIDISLIKEIINSKSFVFDFTSHEENIYLHIYFKTLPLPKFYPKLGNTIKTLFGLFYDIVLKEDESDKRKSHHVSEITALYDNLLKLRKNSLTTLQSVQHEALAPTLRPYQAESIKWMLQREKNQENHHIDKINPLYIEMKLSSGLPVYFDKYSGYITTEKPLVSSTSKGGILADEMGLGKTVEVLACILLNQKQMELVESSDPEEENELDDVPLIERISAVRDDSSSTMNEKKTRKKLIKSDDTDKIPQGKSTNRIALEKWYNEILSGMSPAKRKAKGPAETAVQCICGDTDKNGIIKCQKCPKYQHKKCFSYEQTLGAYLCPQCWMEKPPLHSKATLIVTPASLKTQWHKEITKHVKGHFKVLKYEGATSTPVYPTQLKDYDVVLTTYNVLQNELRLTESTKVFNLRHERTYSPPSSVLTRLKWWRLCLDEAQAVDAPGRMVSEMARKIDAEHRWAVTGTPISKSISDLQGLIDYLQITPYDDLTTWNKILYEPYLKGNQEAMLSFLCDILWRTAKKDVLDQINIPKMTYLEHNLEFSAVEKFFYKREHQLISADFLRKVGTYEGNSGQTIYDLNLESLDKSFLKKLLDPLLNLRRNCSYPHTSRGRYLLTKKQVTSLKELLNALIAKNISDSEDCLRLIVSSLNGVSGIHLLLQNHQEAVDKYREVLQLAARFSDKNNEAKLNVDKPQVIHAMHNLAEVLDTFIPSQPTLRDEHLRRDCAELEKTYMEKFISECTNAFTGFNALMENIEKMQDEFALSEGQWYSDGLNWIVANDYFTELTIKIENICLNSFVDNTMRSSNERQILKLIYNWDDNISKCRIKLFDVVQNLYDFKCQTETELKIVVRDEVVVKAMNCHLRPQQKANGENKSKCDVCVANDCLKKYEAILFNVLKRRNTFEEEMSLTGNWKPTYPELILKSILSVLRSKNAGQDFIKDGELQLNLIDNLKKEFKELRRLWTLLDQQVCAKDELDICKIRFQLKTEEEKKKVNNALKKLMDDDMPQPTLNLLSIHELDYHLSLLENEAKLNSGKLEKLLGTLNYLETLRKQQYEGQQPDPCPICKNDLKCHWSILLCGHSYCLECIEILLDQTTRCTIQCSICRNRQKVAEISYIKTGVTSKEIDSTTIQGNYSTKIEAVVKLLLDLKKEDKNAKVLVFSCWLTILKCLKEALLKNSLTCELPLGGQLDEKINNFKDLNKNITVLLLPINLGSKGLNLIEANRIILIEPVLNPADELQAIGRINRIGQTRQTFVHKFIIKNTIEENIHLATTSNAENWDKSRVTVRNLVDLFNTTEELDDAIIAQNPSRSDTDRGEEDDEAEEEGNE